MVICLAAVPWCRAAEPPENPAAAGAHGADQPWCADPVLHGAEHVTVFNPRYEKLWTEALDQPDMETQGLAAAAIGEAHARKLRDFSALAPKLRGMLAATQQPALRRTLVRALIQLDDRAAAPALAALQDEAGVDQGLVLRIDQTLAAWEAAGGLDAALAPRVRERWLKLAQEDAPRALRQSAVQALGVVKEARAAAALTELVTQDQAPATLRTTTATALAQIDPAAAAAVAARLTPDAGERGLVGRLCAALLLARAPATDAGAVALLRTLAQDAEPAVAVQACDRLAELGPQAFTHELAQRLLAYPDAQVRMTAVQALLAEGSADAAVLITPLLRDPDPQVRCQAREAIITLAQHGQSQVVLPLARQILAGEDWRGREQACFILGALQDEESTATFLQLWNGPRPEVRLAACVALRRLARPQTLAPVLKHVEELSRKYRENRRLGSLESYGELGEFEYSYSLAAEATQLVQMLGPLHDLTADRVLNTFVGRSGADDQARAAAIWSLGLLHEGKPDADLARRLLDRINDVNGPVVEDEKVRSMAAVALGRMGMTEAVPTLVKYMQSESFSTAIGGGCHWALVRIEGEQAPPLPKQIDRVNGWFLEPAE